MVVSPLTFFHFMGVPMTRRRKRPGVTHPNEDLIGHVVAWAYNSNPIVLCHEKVLALRAYRLTRAWGMESTLCLMNVQRHFAG